MPSGGTAQGTESDALSVGLNGMLTVNFKINGE